MTDDQIETLRALMGSHHVERILSREALRAIDAALALTERRCGNCGHWTPSWPGLPKSKRGECKRFETYLDSDDGCILGWVAKS